MITSGASARRPACVLAAVLPWLLVVHASPAAAHVKWFCAFDVAAQPVLLEGVLSRAFLVLAVVSVAGLWIGTRLDRSRPGEALALALDRLSATLRSRSEAMVRACYGAFFASLFTLGNIILTPELNTTLPWVPWLQAAIALGLLFRHTMVLSALGMVVLFGLGLQGYGLFHMMDYPIFLGAALYFALCGLGIARIGTLRPVDVLRWGAAITLMWASVEKWAYPEWTYPLLITHARMAMGLDPHFYMTAAGLVEFGFAFALVCRPLAARLSAIMLTGMFTSAVLEFGKIDAIGHLPIIVILVAIAADDRRVQAPDRSALVPALYAGALTFTIALYYGIHSALFGSSII